MSGARRDRDYHGVLGAFDRLLRGQDAAMDVRKFPEADETLTTQMKSVGEAMSIGRTFREAFQKAIRSGSETPWLWFGPAGSVACAPRGDAAAEWPVRRTNWPASCRCLRRGGLGLSAGLRAGWTIDRIHDLTGIDRWFLAQFASLVEFEDRLLACGSLDAVPAELWHEAKAAWVLGCPVCLGLLGIEPTRGHFASSRSTKITRNCPGVQTGGQCARPSSKRRRRITTPRMKRPPKPLKVASAPPSVKPAPRTGKGHHSWWWSQPHWPRHRVRLLLRSGLVCRR